MFFVSMHFRDFFASTGCITSHIGQFDKIIYTVYILIINCQRIIENFSCINIQISLIIKYFWTMKKDLRTNYLKSDPEALAGCSGAV